MMPSILTNLARTRVRFAAGMHGYLNSTPGRRACAPYRHVSSETAVRPRGVPDGTELSSIRYLGSKRKLLPRLVDRFADIRGDLEPRRVTLIDLFSGSGLVTARVARAGYHCMSFDTASYARTLAAGFTAPFTPEVHTAIERMRHALKKAS